MKLQLPYKSNDLCPYCDCDGNEVTVINWTGEEYTMSCECGEEYPRPLDYVADIEELADLWEENDHKPRFNGYEIQEIAIVDGEHLPITCSHDREELVTNNHFGKTYWCLFGHLSVGGREDLIDRDWYDDIIQVTYDIGIDRATLSIEDYR